MAVAYDAVGGTENTSAASLTWTHVVTGSDTILIVFTQSTNASACSGVTFNGDAMTSLLYVQGGSNSYIRAWYLLNPDTGSHDVVATFAASAGVLGQSISANGAEQAEPSVGSGTIDGPTTISATVDSETGELVIAGVCWFYTNTGGSINISVGSGQTSRRSAQDTLTSSTFRRGAASTKASAASSTSVSYSLDSTPDGFGHSKSQAGLIAISVASVAAGGGGGSTPTRSSVIN